LHLPVLTDRRRQHILQFEAFSRRGQTYSARRRIRQGSRTGATWIGLGRKFELQTPECGATPLRSV